MNICSREQPFWKKGDRVGHKPYPHRLALLGVDFSW